MSEPFEEIAPARKPTHPEFEIAPLPKNRYLEREQQLTTQRQLLEKLRYKGYVRRGTLGDHMQRMGNFARRHGWIIIALAYGIGWLMMQ